jgi:predicted deacylase
MPDVAPATFARVLRLLVLASLVACAPLPTEPRVRSVPREAALTIARPAVTPWRELARSFEGRPIRVRTVGSGPRQVLWVGGIHGNEPEGALATAALPADFLANDLGARVTLTIIEDLNPDGRAANTRANARGVDLNRNFPARTFAASAERGTAPLSEPEAKAMADLVLSLRPALVVVCHAWHDRHFINYDGPAKELAQLFAALSGYPLVESRTFKATPGSLGQWVGADLGLPILTLEWRKGRDWQLAWEDVRLAALAVIEGQVPGGR